MIEECLVFRVDDTDGWKFNYLMLSHKCKSSCLNKMYSNKYANLNVDVIIDEHLMCKGKSSLKSEEQNTMGVIDLFF